MPSDRLTEVLNKTLQALHETDVGDGLSPTAWWDCSEQSRSTFFRNRKLLADAEFVVQTNKRWRLTDKGKAAIQ